MIADKSPPLFKTILVLANSRKLSGRCIAGVELDEDWRPLGWVRPVSGREHGEVSEYERQYSDGSHPDVLDVAQVPLVKHVPETYQSENWLIDKGAYWEFVWGFGITELSPLVDSRDLWAASSSSTRYGLNDRIPKSDADKLRDSLRLIHVDSLRYRVFAPGEDYGNENLRVQAIFSWCGHDYRVFVTDPIVERDYLAHGRGFHDIGAAFLTVSLGEPYNDYCYRLVAAVIAEAGGDR
ncbi:dual OB domain-containing protein [Gordonia sp. NPDC062954]|uniref:dual OB domain-containing protein n=1 Tax=unclassified Gordonia (in: high G+C Gram-positive bacteria) TaxID=2657482 RepID=UPI002579E2FC|nr:hypothetical protein [Gordonia sp. (in: high G+C Gram-positive bacteria)]